MTLTLTNYFTGPWRSQKFETSSASSALQIYVDGNTTPAAQVIVRRSGYFQKKWQNSWETYKSSRQSPNILWLLTPKHEKAEREDSSLGQNPLGDKAEGTPLPTLRHALQQPAPSSTVFSPQHHNKAFLAFFYFVHVLIWQRSIRSSLTKFRVRGGLRPKRLFDESELLILFPRSLSRGYQITEPKRPNRWLFIGLFSYCTAHNCWYVTGYQGVVFS